MTGDVGVQLTVAPTGRLETEHEAFGASLGPLLVQVIVPVAVVPAAGAVGKPDAVACMSA